MAPEKIIPSKGCLNREPQFTEDGEDFKLGGERRVILRSTINIQSEPINFEVYTTKRDTKSELDDRDSGKVTLSRSSQVERTRADLS